MACTNGDFFMYKFIIISLISFFLLPSAFAEGPNFDLGPGESAHKWGVLVPITDESSDFKLRLGTRLQALMESSSSEDAAGVKSNTEQDFYVRRARLQVEAKFQENMSYYMDIRADKIDKGSSGKNAFAIGDAYFQLKNLFGNENLKLKLFRAKYDVSRSQTVSSSRLLIPNRASVSNFAADYISKGRRGTNIQLLGNWSNKIKTQIAIGDSVKESGFLDALGNKSDIGLNAQGFAHGVRVRISPFTGLEEKKLKETQFGHGQHLSIGAAAFFVNNINYTFDDGVTNVTNEVDRELYNFDLSFHFGPVSFAGEYFIFNDIVEDYTAVVHRTGKSEGWTAQLDYTLTELHYIAPYVRYQYWDRFTDNADFDQESWAIGANYFLKGNKLRVGAYYEMTEYGDNLTTALDLNKDELFSLNLMMHY